VPESLIALLVALLGGAAVGVERQWSGHATGPGARFAGVRTFALLGALGGIAGQLWIWDASLLAVGLLLLAGSLVLVGYAVAARHDVDATTEVAALIVIGAGLAAGLGQAGVASGIAPVTALILHEKSQVHDLIGRLQAPELGAAFRFAVMAVVILPLLPEGPIGTWMGGVRPRDLWLLVLFFSGLSFLGYVAQRAIGVSHGVVVAGLLGGIVSSTSVTLAFARRSREMPGLARHLARGAIAANTVLYARVLLAALVLSPPLAWVLAPIMAGPASIGVVAVLAGPRQADAAGEVPLARNPLQLRGALEMAAVFQLVILLVGFIGREFGAAGVLGTAAVVGLTDADALTLSMAREVGAGALTPGLAARAVTVGLLSNTLVKMAMAFTAGRDGFRAPTLGALTGMAIALAIAALLTAA
jgi:uncharacterized membrane protein (DUF4010 family)